MKQKDSNFLIVLFLSFLFFSCNEKQIEIEGIVLTVGNEPFTKLVIRSDNKDFVFNSIDKKKYSELQGKTVRFWGNVTKSEMQTADGSYSLATYKLSTDSLKVPE